MNVLAIYNRLKDWPFGKFIFSVIFSFFAPYFFSIRPYVEDLKPGYASVSMRQRWFVQNHIKTIHAIATCNLIEAAMGLVVSASIPDHLRWIPKGMDVQYIKKATGKITATVELDPTKFFTLSHYPGDVIVPVVVKNEESVIVAKGDVRIYLSEKSSKSKNE